MTLKKISLLSLVLLIVAPIDSIRNLPSSALFGSALVFFFIFAALIFLIPAALVSAELSATFPEKGGIYHWVKTAFGEKIGMLAIWLQWINTMVWYPTILSFIAGTAAYLINPELGVNKWFLVITIPVIFWTMTLVNLRGVHVSAKVNGVCGFIGMVIPMIFLIILGGIWYFSGKNLAIPFHAESLIPNFSDKGNWVSLVAIMASYLGIELSGVHVNDIKDPQKNFPKAVFISTLFILLTMMFGSLAIAFVIPGDQINLLSGVIQVFDYFFGEFGMRGFTPVLAILIVIGSIGSMTNWLISPAKGLLHASEFGYLPRFFTKRNANGVASRIMFAQGVLVTLFCLLFLLVPSVNAFYWFLTALSTGLYMLMYILMFLCAIQLHYKHKKRGQVFKIPGKTPGMWITTTLGIFGCISTITVSFFPPDNVHIASPYTYFMMILLGNVVCITPVILFYLYKNKTKGKIS